MTNPGRDGEELSPVKRALLELRELRAQLDATERRQREPIAIVGVGLRFPGGAHDPASFWRLLRDGVDAITEVPSDRWDADALYDPDPLAPGKMTTRYGGFLDDVDAFDPHFFGITPREAVSMDPQQRLLLEVSWEALEHAGQAPDALFGSQTGVFLGISHSDYWRLLLADPEKIDAYATTGNTLSIAAGRLAYLLGLHGPNMAIDTACSASLVAVHLACQSLRQGECDLALAGGVNLILTPELSINFSKANMLAPDGRCKTFDAAADGYVRSEGCGMVVLKRLGDALAANDHILAVIRGSAINQDGRSGGLTAPNGPAQEAVIRRALANAGVEADQVGYVEAHGTGTALGDPIEIGALAAALGRDRTPARPLIVGSVKTNLGHLEAAAGIAGLLKVVLALQHGELPPHLHFTTLNPHIAAGRPPILVPTERLAWPADRPRLAGVSSFGLSGSNAHVIVEAAPERAVEAATVERPLHLLCLSARTPQAMAELVARYQAPLAAAPAADFADICHTAATGRGQFGQRLAVVAGAGEAAWARLAAHLAGDAPFGVLTGQVTAGDAPEVAFLFTGHGSHYVGMGRRLYATQPTFRATLDRCDALLQPLLGRSLLAILLADDPADSALLDRMEYAQPALFSLQYALAMLWQAWGVRPTLALGHSAGEYVAACLAGVFSLEDGLKLIAARGRLMQALPPDGEMAAIFAPETTVAAVIAPFGDQVAIAAVNGATSIAISGVSAAVQAVIAACQAQGIESRRLAIPIAAHSPLVEPILDEFERVAATIRYAPPQLGLVSTMTGKLVASDEVTHANYWRRHLRQPVRFAAAVQTLLSEGSRVFVEIGPHPTLIGMARRDLPDDLGVWAPSLRRDTDDWEQILESLGILYTNGVAIDWAGFDRDYPRRRRPLPTYPWQRSRYRIEAGAPVPRSTDNLWAAVLAAGDHQAQHGPLDLALETYPAKWAFLERLTTAYIAQALRTLGAFGRAGERATADDVLTRLAIQPVYRNLLARWLTRLATIGLLERDGEAFASPAPLPAMPIEALWQEARPVLDDLPFLQAYVRRCGERLGAVLTGAASPLETLFPDGSSALAEDLYQHWAMSRYFAGLVRAVIEASVRMRPANRPLRILEIGAGTGATTAAVLPVLPADRMSYHFTDVSDLFLARAADKFRTYPFMRFGLLDIEKAPAAQGYPDHAFDLVIATNVLHATRDLRQTVRHVLDLLAPGGLLVLNEATSPLAWMDMTTGLIGGWQRFEDDLRDDTPLLDSERWQDLLTGSGFAAVAAWPAAGAPPAVLGQHVIAARAPAIAAAGANGHLAWRPASAPAAAGSAEAGDSLVTELTAMLPFERQDHLIAYVRGQLRRILRLAADHPIDPNERLMDLGLDSLMALEFRSLLGRGLNLAEPLPATLIFDQPSVTAIATYLERLLLPAGGESAAAAGAAAGPTATAASLADLSDDEVERLLLKRLETMPQ